MSTQDEDELKQQLREILKAPMRSKVSTSDIAVGFWSSTALGEKLHDLENFILAREQSIKEQAERDTLARCQAAVSNSWAINGDDKQKICREMEKPTRG